jgi:hypothetical protein
VLTPNQQLFVIFAMFVLLTTFAGVLYVLTHRYMVAIDKKLGLPATPLWRHVLAEASAILTHDWGEELDELMLEVNDLPDKLMSVERLDRLEQLLKERAESDRADLRPGEREVARMYLDFIALMRIEGKSGVPLTNALLIGRQVPAGQTRKDKANAAEDAE